MENLEQYNLILIGDSITKGLYLDNGEIKKTKQNAVDIINRAFNCQIHNLSMFGQSLERVFQKKLYLTDIKRYYDSNKKNVVVISLGGNDADYDWESVAKAPTAPHTNKTPLATFNLHMQEIIDELKKMNIDVFFTALYPMDSKRYYTNYICKNYDEKIIKKYLNNDITNLHRNQDSYNSAVMMTALTNGCKFIDIRTPLLQKNEFLTYLSKDGIHPNLKGQQEIAKIVTDYIKNYVE